MNINKNSIILMSDTKKISHILNPNLYVPRKEAWIKKDIVSYENEYFHVKKTSSQELINELLGSYLSQKINLDAVDNRIAIDDNYNLYALSRIFYERNNRYFKVYEFGYNTYYMYDYKIKKDNILDSIQESYSKLLLDELLKMIALDLKMMQSDRNASNIIFKITKHGYQLSKVYDFGEAYTGKFGSYFNPFIILFLNKNSLKKLIRQYPNIGEYIEKLNNIKIVEALEEISVRFNITFSKSEYEFYMKKDEEITKILKM